MTAQDVSVQLQIAGVFTEQVEAKGAAAGDVFAGEGMRISRKYTELQGLNPDEIGLTFNNDTDRYNLENPTSDLYGLIGRNTPVRARIGGFTRITAEATSWQPGEDVHNRATCDLTALGILGRIGTWTDSLHSPMFRTISNTTGLLGYYPMEDGKQAGTALTNTVPTGIPGAMIGGEYAGGDGPDGSEPIVKSVTGCAIGGNFISSSSTAGWQFFFAFKLATMPTSATFLPLVWVKSTAGYIYYIEVNNDTYNFRVVDSAGTTLENTAVAGPFGEDIPTNFVWFRLKVVETAGTISLEPAWYTEASGTFGITLGFTGTAGQPTRFGHTGNAYTDGALYGHAGAVSSGATDLLAASFKDAFIGHKGETAQTRYARLTFEEGIERYVLELGISSFTMPMGVQRADTLLKLLQECADTDDALIYDEPTDIAVTWRARYSRYNLVPVLTLQYPDDIAKPFRPVFDDASTGNYVTAKNRDGGEATVEQITGTMSTSPPPDGVGRVKKTIDVNVGDEDVLTQIADHWRVKGTVAGARYPTVIVDLFAHPELEAAAEDVNLGDMIQIDGYRAEPILLHVMGIEERTGSVTRELAFSCVDGAIWQTGVWQDVADLDFRWASRTTTLNASRTSGQTSWVFTFTDVDDAWSTSPGAGYDCLVAGERITVTAMGAVSGSGPWTQTATVTRAVNGVSKDQNAGAAILVAEPLRWTLG